ncbi:MAG TPA: hypothetical protein VNO79_10350, partial [Actinomycetota bacterium]|nr:hypothetical protein [Actinomycetota bacterium]
MAARSDPRIHRLPDRRDGSPRWQARWWGADGRQGKKTFSSLGEARAHLLAVDRAKAQGTYVNPALGRRRLEDYFASWISAASLEEATRELYSGTFARHIRPSLGRFQLAALSRETVKSWVAELGERGVGARTIAVAHQILRRVLAEAVRDGVLATNPAAGVEVPRSERRAMRPLSAREVAALAEAVPGRDRALIFVLGYAGLRIGEAAALRVGDV